MEPSAAGESCEESVSGEGRNPPAPKPRGAKRGSSTPKRVTRRAAARIRAKALNASRKAPKAQEQEVEEEEEEEEDQKALDGGGAAKAGSGEGEQSGQESPLVVEPNSSRTSQPQPLQPLTKEAGQMSSPMRSPNGAREKSSQPDLPTIEQDEFVSLPSESPWEEPAAKRAKTTPQATFTPTAAGLRPGETQEPGMSPQITLIISKAIAQGIAAGIQQNQPVASDNTPQQGQPPAPDNPGDLVVLPRPPSPASSMRSQEFLSDDEEQKELMLCEDEGETADPLGFKGIFRPALFKALLYRAKATARLGEDPAASDPASGLSDANNLFSEATTGNEEIPSPKLFLDAVQKQWAQPGGYAAPSDSDKRFYNMASNLATALEMPTIDEPMVALAAASSSTMMSNDVDEVLNPQDRKSELTLRKIHQAAAWAVKSALAASFFNRTSLLWLKEMQARIPATDLHTHQDLKNLVAAAEFSADATLNSAKFSSRTIASSVTARRLLWLRHWQANMKLKWRLASAPFKGDNLFGEALEPMLIETRDKKKFLRPMSRRPDQRPQQPSFRATDTAQDFSQPQGAYFQHQDRQSDRPSDRDNSRQQFESEQPIRGNESRPPNSVRGSLGGNNYRRDVQRTDGPEHHTNWPRSRYSSNAPEVPDSVPWDNKSSHGGSSATPVRSSTSSATAVRRSTSSATPLRRSTSSATFLRRSTSSATFLRHSTSSATALRRSTSSATALRRSTSSATALRRSTSSATALRRSTSSATALRRSTSSATAVSRSSSSATAVRRSTSSATALRHSSHHSSDSRSKKPQQASRIEETQNAAPPVHRGDHLGGQLPDVNRSHGSIPTTPYIADTPMIPIVLLREPALPVQSPPTQPVFSTQNIHAEPSNALASPQDYPYSHPTPSGRPIEPNLPPPANRRSQLQITDPSIARILSQLQRDLVVAYRQTSSPRSTYRQDSMRSVPVPGPPRQHQSSGEPDLMRPHNPSGPPPAAVRQDGVRYYHPSQGTSAYQGRTVLPPASPEIWQEQFNYRNQGPIRNPPPGSDVTGHSQGMYIQGNEPSHHRYEHQFVQPRSPYGDPDGTRPVVTGGHPYRSRPSPPERHLRPPHTSPDRQRSHQDSYQWPREQPVHVPDDRRRSQDRTASSTYSRRR